MAALPDSFLGGSTPRLERVGSIAFHFQDYRNYLSAAHLVTLYLYNIPYSGFMSPETMATTLSVLTRLEFLSLEFQSPRSHLDRASRHPPPLTRSVLSSLALFRFEGVCEYLDDLVARIDAPICSLYTVFFDQIVFDSPQFVEFIDRTPTLNAPVKAYINLWNDGINVNFSSQTISGSRDLTLGISGINLSRQLLSLGQVCTSFMHHFSSLEDLYIYEHPRLHPHEKGLVEKKFWLELLHPFAAVENLYISEEFVPCIVSALQELVGGRTTEVLPTLQIYFLRGPPTIGACPERH